MRRYDTKQKKTYIFYFQTITDIFDIWHWTSDSPLKFTSRSRKVFALELYLLTLFILCVRFPRVKKVLNSNLFVTSLLNFIQVEAKRSGDFSLEVATITILLINHYIKKTTWCDCQWDNSSQVTKWHRNWKLSFDFQQWA